MNSSEIYRKNRCIFGALHKNSLVISTGLLRSDSMMGFKGFFDPFPHLEIRRPIWEGFLLISRPSWLLERSAILIIASNHSVNIVIPPLFRQNMATMWVRQRFLHTLYQNFGTSFSQASLYCVFPQSGIRQSCKEGRAA